MSRKSLVSISVISVIAILLIAQTIPAQQVESLRDVTPERPLIFFQKTGAAAVIDMYPNLWKQIAQAPFWEIVYAELEARSRVKDIHLAIEPGLSLLFHIFGEDIIFVLPQFDVITEVSPLIMIKLKSSDDELGMIIANGIRIALANAAQATVQYGGYNIASIPLPGDAPFALSCALLDDVFAVGLGVGTMEDVIDLMNDSGDGKGIMDDPGFSSAMERLPLPKNNATGQHTILFHANLASIVAFGSAFYPLVRGNVPMEIAPIIERALKWIDLVPAVSSAFTMTDEGLISQGYVALNPDANAQNFLKMLEVEPENLGSRIFVPGDVIGYAGTNLIDLKSIWSMAHNTMADLPGIGDQLPGQLEQLQENLGIDFEEDIFSWMDNEIAWVYNDIMTSSRAFMAGRIMPDKACLIIGVTDEEKAQAGLKALTDMLSAMSQGQLVIQERDYMGETIHEASGLPIPMTPGYVLSDGYLLISPSSEYLQKMLDCAAGREKGLESNASFLEISDRLPEKANSMQFFDFRQYLKAMMGNMAIMTENMSRAVVAGDMPDSEGEESALRQTVISQAFELVDTLGQAVGASVSHTVNDGTGLKSRGIMRIEDLDRVVPISDPDDAKLARNLYIANRYKEAEMMDRAVERYKMVLKLDEGNWQATMNLAQIMQEQDKNLEAKEYMRQTGFVPENSWYIIGPFENDMGEGFSAQYPPEEAIELEAEYEVAEGSIAVKWEKLTDGKDDGFVDLLEMVDPSEWAVAYAWTKVISAETQEVELRTGSDDQLRVWLNGEEVISHEMPRQVQPDQDVVSVTLKQGENQLLVKVCNEEMDWGFYLRFTEPGGKSLEGLKFGD